MNQTQALEGTKLGADVWNRQGNAAFFRYEGTTTANPDDYADDISGCTGITHNLVYFDGANGPDNKVIGQLFGKCRNAQGEPTKFVLRVYLKKLNGNPFGHGNGYAGAPFDLPALVAHELGHSLSVHHSGEEGDGVPDVYSTMWYTTGNTAQRVLYEYDLTCARALSGTRYEGIYYRTQNSLGNFGGATEFAATFQAKAAIGYGVDGSTETFTSVSFEPDFWGLVFSSSLGSGGTAYQVNGVTDEDGIGFSLGLWRESPTIDRVFYQQWLDYPTTGHVSSYHKARQVRSTDNFYSNQTASDLKYCESMSGFMQCNSSVTKVDVAAIAPPTMAWLSGTGKTMHAWVADDRGGGLSNQINISVGAVTDSLLSKPIRSSSYTSSVPPGLACSEDFATGGWDCVIAYVDLQDMSQRVTIRRIKINTSGAYGNYQIDWDSPHYPPTGWERTASQIAVWHHYDTQKFYIAYQSTNSLQKLVVLKGNSSATSWSTAQTDLDYTIYGPTSASVKSTTNQKIMYLK